jgi:hypothetical protein
MMFELPTAYLRCLGNSLIRTPHTYASYIRRDTYAAYIRRIHTPFVECVPAAVEKRPVFC